MKYIITSAFLLAGAPLTVAPATAQTAPISRSVPLTFTGVVANDITNTIKVRQPDGTTVPYVGPVPDYPYKAGDPVTISFNATLPTKAFYEPGGPYHGQIAADGIYRISLGGQTGSGYTPGPGGVSAVTVPDVSGPISGDANGYGSYARMIIVYDSKADTYSLEFPNGSWGLSDMNGPSYTYDQTSGALAPAAANCRGGTRIGCNDINPGGFGITGNESSASANISIWSPATNNDPNTSYIDGLFNLLINGSWNLPTWNGGSGGSTEVPEPGMAVLFGSGALAMLARRRRKAAA